MPVVAAALGDDVDDAAGGAAELGAIAAGLHLRFRDRLERQLRISHALVDVGDVEAVDVIRVLRDRRPAERGQVAERGVAARGARRQQRNAGDVARDRHGIELRFGEDRGRLDRGQVDRIDHVAGHFDHVERGRIGRERDRGAGADVDADFARLAVMAHAVAAGRQRTRTEVAIGIDRDFALEAGGQVLDDDGAAGGLAKDVAAGVRLRMDAVRGQGHRKRERTAPEGVQSRHVVALLNRGTCPMGVFGRTRTSRRDDQRHDTEFEARQRSLGLRSHRRGRDTIGNQRLRERNDRSDARRSSTAARGRLRRRQASTRRTTAQPRPGGGFQTRDRIVCAASWVSLLNACARSRTVATAVRVAKSPDRIDQPGSMKPRSREAKRPRRGNIVSMSFSPRPNQRARVAPYWSMLMPGIMLPSPAKAFVAGSSSGRSP